MLADHPRDQRRGCCCAGIGGGGALGAAIGGGLATGLVGEFMGNGTSPTTPLWRLCR